MLKWLWCKPVKEYVPVADGWQKPYVDRWQDDGYLKEVVQMSGNRIFNSEAMNALSELRDVADQAKTPDFLAGVNCGILAVKRILTAPARARVAIDSMRAIDNDD